MSQESGVASGTRIWRGFKPRRSPAHPSNQSVAGNSSSAESLKIVSRSYTESIQRIKQAFKRRSSQTSCHTLSLPLGVETRLPPELWQLIFREATDMGPDPLDSRSQLCFLTMSSVRWTTYVRSIKTKVALSQVSRRFRELSESILYEFIWIRRASQAKALAHTLIMFEPITGITSPGHFIRHLHIETSMLHRCAPDDVHKILSHAPQLQIYTDNQSVRRYRYDPKPDPESSPAQLFRLLTHPNNGLRRLAWTTYSDQPFHLDMAPLLSDSGICARLEYLELSNCSAFDFTNRSASVDARTPTVSLPALQTLKVNLDNTTFMVLSAWSMPSLANLSVVSCDFSYAGDGFSAFFHAHGPQLKQLELGHSSSQISEQPLTPPAMSNRFRLAEWCPNLKEFICSADAEWNWTTPDWIAPHVLMPAHPTLEFIAIRDIDSRLRADSDLLGSLDPNDPAPFFPLFEQISSLLHHDAFPSLRFIRDLSEESHALRTTHPQLRVIRFWERVIQRCSQKGVWCEDFEGMNVTMPGLRRASMRAH